MGYVYNLVSHFKAKAFVYITWEKKYEEPHWP